MSGRRPRASRARISSAATSRRFRQATQAMSEPLEQRTLLAAVSWDGGPAGTGTDWSNPVNWSGDVKPGAGDDALIMSAGPTITLAQSESVNSVTSNRAISVRNGTWTIAAPSQLEGLTITGGGIGGVLTGTGDVTVTGAFNWINGRMEGAGRTIVAPGGTLLMDPVANLGFARELINNGTGTMTGNPPADNVHYYFQGGTMTNNGTLTLDSTDGPLSIRGNNGANLFTNNGTLTKTGSGTATLFNDGVPMPFNNTGTAT